MYFMSFRNDVGISVLKINYLSREILSCSKIID